MFMFSSTLFDLAGLSLSVAAEQIKSSNSAFSNKMARREIPPPNNSSYSDNSETKCAGVKDGWISVTDGTFQWAGTNKYIDLTDGKITDGNVLQIHTCDSKNTNQQWRGDTNPDSARAVNIIGGDSSPLKAVPTASLRPPT
ncbi:hypothetical protein B0H14DRAFT_3532941 [Mycena olivaceomarginata]|nr:hypothetical protein B0H14DRAFT_3532941 [Mycena olivaceomarginata]